MKMTDKILFTEEFSEEIELEKGYIDTSYSPPGKNEHYTATMVFAYLNDGILYGDATVEKIVKREGKGSLSKLFAKMFPEKLEWWIDTRRDKSGRIDKDGFSRIEPGFEEVRKTLEGIAARENVSLNDGVLYKLFEDAEDTVKYIYDKVREL